MKLDEELNELMIEIENPILLCERAIELILYKLDEIKKFVLKRGFNDDIEEIQFFKKLKPNVLSKLIYYNSVYNIDTKMPQGSKKTIKKYLNNELSKLKRYFDNNFEFYKYYRTDSSYLDDKYFIRGRHDIKLSLNSGVNNLKDIRIQLLNQYNFVLGLISLIYALRDLFYGLFPSFYILGSFGLFLLITLFYTTKLFKLIYTKRVPRKLANLNCNLKN